VKITKLASPETGLLFVNPAFADINHDTRVRV